MRNHLKDRPGPAGRSSPGRAGGRVRLARAQPLLLAPAASSQASTLSGLSSIHFLAASSGSIWSSAMYFATRFWSSLVQWNAFTRSYAGLPDSANFFETTLFSGYGG